MNSMVNWRALTILSAHCAGSHDVETVDRMKMTRASRSPWRLCISVLAGFLAVSVAEAQEPPPAPAAGSSCLENDHFMVISHSGDGIGNQIIARAKSSLAARNACAFNDTPADYHVAQSGEAKYALGLRRNFLILDEGTGPSLRWLRIVDLSARREVWRAQYVPEPAPRLSRHGVIFSKYLRTARKNDCRNYRRIVSQGFTPLYVTKGEISLPDLSFKAGPAACLAGQ
jgi:hypothetical protein